MPPILPIDLSNFPAFQTRKALLIIDLQNEFLSPGGGLPVPEPVGYVDRGLDVAKRFRETGAGDVFWICSQFEVHRPAAHALTMTSSASRFIPASQRAPGPHKDTEGSLDADPEMFLSLPQPTSDASQIKSEEGHPLSPGSFGSELAPSAALVVDNRQDIVIAKSHYSAFEGTKLLTRLRTRFVTELFVYGVLTNISIHATALDAARHGLTLTIIEDCCGYRDAIRHANALQNLVNLTGCDTILAEHLVDTLPPLPKPSQTTSGTSIPAAGSAPAAPATPFSNFAAAIAAIAASSQGPPRIRKTHATGPGDKARNTDGVVSHVASLPVRSKAKDTPLPTSSPQQEETPTLSKPGTESHQISRISEAEANLDGETRAGLIHKHAQAPLDVMSTLGADMRPSSSFVTEEEDIIEAGDGSDESDVDLSSFIPTLPSRHEKLLQYARLQAKHQAGKAKDPLPTKTSAMSDSSQLEQQSSSGPQSPGTVEKNKTLSNHAASHGQRQTDKGMQATKGNAVKPAATTGSTAGVHKESHRSAVVLGEAADGKTGEADERGSNGPIKGGRNTSTDQSVRTGTPSLEPCQTSGSSPGPAQGEIPTGSAVRSTIVPGEERAGTTHNSEASPVSQIGAVSTTGGMPHEPTVKARKLADIGPICEGDTEVYHNVLPKTLEDGIYEKLCEEVHWKHMFHQGGEVPRLVCVQGAVDFDEGNARHEGIIPVYRHPADESLPLDPFSCTVLAIKRHIEEIAGHPLNHALIQHYRTGSDYISEHSDKTLDIVPGSYVCNVSLGAERTMVFRTKKATAKQSAEAPDGDQAPKNSQDTTLRKSCRVQLPHNSLCRMGLQTNMKWLHAIRQDKRAPRDKTKPEVAYNGGRVSLTFRRIGTFLNKDETLIWGQGATGKTREEAHTVNDGKSDEAIKMLKAFGAENHSSSFDWKAHYGRGFDVLHMNTSPRFFAGADGLVNSTIRLFLADLGINYAKGSIGNSYSSNSSDPIKSKGGETTADAHKSRSVNIASSLEAPVRFVDNDQGKTSVTGLLGILLYLDAIHGTAGVPASVTGKAKAGRSPSEAAHEFTRLQQAILLQDKWRLARRNSGGRMDLKAWKDDLAIWDAYMAKYFTEKPGATSFLSGACKPTLADYTFWPVLLDMGQLFNNIPTLITENKQATSTFAEELSRVGLSSLCQYYQAMVAYPACKISGMAGDTSGSER